MRLIARRMPWLTAALFVALLVLAISPAESATFYLNYIFKTASVQPQPTVQPQPSPTAPPDQGPTPPPSEGTVPNTPVDTGILTVEEQQMLILVNAERRNAGLKPVVVDPRLVATARAKSRDMIVNGYFGHNSPVLGSPFLQMRQAGVNFRYAAENIAGSASVTRAHNNLMNSPGHRNIILNPRVTHIGIGIVTGGPYGKMFTQHFVQL